MKAMMLTLVMACGPIEATDFAANTTTVHRADPADAGHSTNICNCCWPAYIHGPGRCRYARADSVPPDPCESDPEQRCVYPDAGGAP